MIFIYFCVFKITIFFIIDFNDKSYLKSKSVFVLGHMAIRSRGAFAYSVRGKHI